MATTEYTYKGRGMQHKNDEHPADGICSQCKKPRQIKTVAGWLCGDCYLYRINFVTAPDVYQR